MTKSFTELKQEDLIEHNNLDIDDSIFHLEYYESGGTFQESTGNNLIINLKKRIDKKGESDWIHKKKAIRSIAVKIAEELNSGSENAYRRIYWIPVPPSKMKTDPMYDDRVYQILVLSQAVCNDDRHLVADVIYQKESREPFTAAKSTRSVEDLLSNYEMNDIPNYNPETDLIVIFDDVLTSGCHFKAVKSKILGRYSNAKIRGIFVARTIPRKQEP